MAIRVDANNEHWARTTNLPTSTAFTFMGWVRLLGTPTSGQYDPIFQRFNTNSCGLAVWHDTVNPRWNLGDNVGDAGGSTVTTNTWYHVAWVRASSSSDLLYFNGVQDISANLADGTTDNLQVANWSYGTEAPDARFAAIQIYDAVLTAAEIVNEMRQYLPIRRANLNGFYPFLSTADDEIDFSGAGNNWTVTGTPTTEDGPPIPWCLEETGRIYVPGGGGGEPTPRTPRLIQTVVRGQVIYP